MKRYRCGLRVIGSWDVMGVGVVYKGARSKMNETVEMLDCSAFGRVIVVVVVRR